jgi:glycosyltransferase involved in cell wall biosynthesis
MKNLTVSKDLAAILIVSSFPPRVCGIATYTQDLTRALQNKFSSSLSIKICALESDETSLLYPPEVKYILKTSSADEYEKTAVAINLDPNIKIVLIQHEFGFFKEQEQAFLEFVYELSKPVVVVFHTVLPYPDELLKLNVQHIAAACTSIVVMTKSSAKILQETYDIPQQKISVIPHGTHLVPHLNKDLLKKKYGLKGRKILTTFGLLSSGKNIETTLEALPMIVAQSPEVLFLVIGKTHPGVVKTEGEQYN